MADTTNNTIENVLVSLNLNIPTTEEQIRALTAGVVDMKKAVDDLNASSAKSTEEKDQAAAAAARQADAVKKTTDAMKAEEGSIAALRNQNKELTKERNNTSLATAEGRKRVEELNAQLDENNKKIKENVDSYTKQKLSVGGYTDALDKLVPGLGATVNGISATTKASLAFIATPIGAVIGALGLAIGAVTAYFKGSEEGQNKWNKITQIGSALLEQLMNVVEDLGGFLVGLFENPVESLTKFATMIKDNLINRFMGLAELIPKLGEALVLLFKGEFAEAGTVAANAIGKVVLGVEDAVGLVGDLIDGVGDLMDAASEAADKAIAMAERLADVQAEIDQEERKLIVERARTTLEVSKLRQQALKEEGDVKMATIQQAIELERQLADEEVLQAQRRLEEAQLKMQIEGDTKEAKLAVAEAEAAVLLAEAGRFEATLRFQKEIERLLDAEAAKRAKNADDEKKRQDKLHKEQVANMTAEQDAMIAFYARQKKLDEDAAKAKMALDKAVGDQNDQILNNLFNTQKIQYTEAFKLMKAGALKQLLATTEKAAMEAYASAAAIPIVGFILGPIAYAAAYAQGAFSLARIAGLTLGFAGGGKIPGISGTKISGGMGIPISRSNGDDLLVTAKRGEVILNEGHQRALGGSDTFRRIGVPGFAASGVIGGAIETRQAFASMDQQTANEQLINAILQQGPPVLVQQDYEYAKAVKDGTAGKAVVVE